MKTCPFCTASIPDEAPKCKHCGEWVSTPPPSASGDGMRMLGEAAKTGVNFYVVMSIIGLIVGAIFFFAFWLPTWNKVNKGHEEFDKRHQQMQQKFDQDWEKSRQQQNEFDRKFDQRWGQ